MAAGSPTLLSTALAHHQRGELSLASQLYRQIISAEPANAEALHLLGVASLQLGQPHQALPLLEQAVALQPGASALHTNLGEAYRALGQLERAESCYRLALRLKPENADAAYNFGLLLMQQGQPAKAADLFRQAIQYRPHFALAYNNLGNACRVLGEVKHALEHFRFATELNPQLGLAHGNLGQLLLECQRPGEALRHCQEAVRLEPQLAPAHNNLGNVFRKLGRLNEAKACYLEALRREPNLAVVYHNLGEVLHEQGQIADAKRCLTEAVQREPNNARFHVSLAKLLLEQRDLAASEKHLLTARRLDPRLGEAHVLLAHLYFEQGRLADAHKEYRALLADRPNDPALNCRLAEVLLELNQRDDALACLRAALRSDPNCSHAVAQLATQLGEKLPAEEEEALRRLLDNPNTVSGERSALLFALAQVCDARRDYEQAARHLAQANNLENSGWQQSGRAYNVEAHANFVNRLLKVFTPAFFERVRGFGSDSERLVFIVGLPRSGTTLLEQVLASHSRVFGAGELRLAREDFEILGGGSDGRCEARAFDILEKIDAETVKRFAQSHLDRLAAINSTADRVLDKMPDNYLYVGFMSLLFPRARFLHCCRDIRDVAVSCWITHFRDIPWSNDFSLIASRFAEYHRVMEHWKKVLPVPVQDVHYEAMVEDLESVARKTVEFLGLEWEPTCLEYYRNKRPVRTASLSQVRQPIYRRSVARWQHYEHALKPLFAQLEETFSPRLVQER
jgi:tetratricopeptide (TPR) repeat protein